MKKIFAKCLTAVFVLSAFFAPFNLNVFADSENNVWKNIYVSTLGNDQNDGSENSPFKTVERAKEEVRKISENMSGDIVVNIADGIYRQTEMLDFTVADSGKNGYNVIYRGEKDKYPVISGGFEVGGFEKYENNPDIYCVSLENYNDVELVRSVFMDGKKYRMAQSDMLIKGEADYDDPDTHYTSDGFYVSKKYMAKYKNPENLELFWSREWVDVICKVDEIIDDPENSGRLIVRMSQSMWQAYKDYPYNGKSPSYDQYFQVINAFELLDKPGEFYYDTKEKKLYIYPYDGTDMKSAKATVPTLERMFYIVGEDIDKKVENITFEGLSLAHTTWLAPGKYGYKGHQVQNTWVTNDCAKYMPGTIKLEWANNINFKNNHIYDHGMSAVDFENAVTNSSVIGNAFNDLDGAAFVEGRREHEEWPQKGGDIAGILEEGDIYADEKYKNPMSDEGKKFYLLEEHTTSTYARQVNGEKAYADEDGMVDLMAANERALIATSYFGKNVGTDRDYKSLRVLVNTEVKNGNQTGAWFGDPYAPEKGEKTWVRADFERKYHINKIVLKFDTNLIGEEYRKSYEILLSNDKNFEDSSTKRVAVQLDTAGEKEVYTVDFPNETFRYMMIRTIGATPFGLTTFYVYSKDKEPYTIIERNKGNEFSNNYAVRCAGSIYSSAVVSTDYTENFKAHHNEIIDTPYTGFEIGSGWSWQPFGSARIDIRNNFVSKTTRFLHDGAAIYTLGFMPYSYIAENYCKTDYTGNGALYPDQGTSYTLWKNNVVEDSGVYAAHFWIKSQRYDKLENTYSDTDMYLQTTDITSKIDAPKVFLPGTMQPEAYEIANNAGLEKEYEYLRAFVPDGSLRLPDEHQCYLSAASMNRLYYIAKSKESTAENMLKNGKFGNLPWEYDYKYYTKIKTALDDTVSRSDPNDIDEIVSLRDAITEARNSVTHLSLDEMREFLKNTLDGVKTYKNFENANYGEYSKTSYDELNEVYKKISSANNLSDKESYALVLDAEEKFESFKNSLIGAEIEYINASDMRGISIDSENRTVTVEFNENIPKNKVNVEIFTNETAECADVNTVLNLEKDAVIPIYQKAKGEYVNWTVKSAQTSGENCGRIGTDKWLTDAKEEYKMFNLTDGALHLDRNCMPYMYNKKCADEFSVNFMPQTPYEKNEFTVVFGAGRADGFKLNSKHMSDAHYELIFSDNSASVMLCKNGIKSAVASVDGTNIKYNGYNDLRVKTEKVNSDVYIGIWLNGEKICSALGNSDITNGYFGFYTPNTAINIK